MTQFELPRVKYNYNPKEASSIKVKEVKYYDRNKGNTLISKQNSKWLCEIDSNHVTFISAANGKNFVESHHLIPISVQGYFEYSLDIQENIISLCPNCHRKIHHGISLEKKEMIEKLFEENINYFEYNEINISLKQLLDFYNIRGVR